MKIRIPILVSIVILAVGLILGSFFDLQIAQGIFSENNGFGIFIAALSFIPGYAFISIVGGLLFASAYKSNKPKWLKVFLYVCSVIAIICATYFSGNEIFSFNGYYHEGIGYTLLGCGICLVIQTAVGFLGFYLFKDNKNENLWLPALIITFAIVIALVPITQIAKIVMDRPRYRLIQTNFYDLRFYNWFERCTNAKGYIALGANKEDFKSFPSGHAGTAVLVPILFSTLIPVARPNLRKYSSLFYYIGFAYVLVVMFARMLVGAHFLSDVCIGALVVVVLFYIANEIILRKNLFKFE